MTSCTVAVFKSKRKYRISTLRRLLRPYLQEPKAPGHHIQRSRTTTKAGDYLDFYATLVTGLRLTGINQAMGLCPFHNDQNPSWSLRVTDGVWHCFGCGAAGNAISFCMMRGLDMSDGPEGIDFQPYRALAIEGGAYITWKKEKENWHKFRMCNFTIEWRQENRVSDRIRLEDRIFEGDLVTDENERIPIRMSNKEFCSNATLPEILIREGGRKIWLNDRYISQIRAATLLFSKAKMLNTNMDFGFHDDTTFLTPTMKITPEGMNKTTDTQTDLSSVEHARHLDLAIVERKELRGLLRHIGNDLLELQPHSVTYPLLGFLGASPLMHFFNDRTRYALWLVGPSGSGKSFIAKLFECFFGDFATQGRVASWSSTANSLQFMGYFFKDCIFMVDDYKPAMVRNDSSVVQFLQTYADLSGRSRLTSEIKSRQDYFIRGSLLTTGEDIPAGHASVVARSLIVPVDHNKPDIGKGKRCLATSVKYPGVTARYIRYLVRRRKLREELKDSYQEAHEVFLKDIEREENAVRIARNLALNWVGFYWFTKFLKEIKAPFNVKRVRNKHLKILIELRDRMLDMIRQEQPAQVFLQTLSEGITSGTFRLRRPGMDESTRGRSYVGFARASDENHVCIFPKEAMAQVRLQQERLGRKFDWTPNALSKALTNHGALEQTKNSKDSGTRVRAFGQLFRVWKIRKDCLGMAEGGADERE